MSLDILITLNDIEIITWAVSLIDQNVMVTYAIKTDAGETYKIDNAIFWAVMPEGDNPGNWYQLPEEYVTTLSNLTSDARSALLHLVNETQ